MKAKMWMNVFCVMCLLLAGGAAMAVSTQQVTYSFWCGQNSSGPESGCAWYDDKVAVIIEGETASDRNTAAMADFVQFFHDLHTAFEQQTGLTNLPLSTGWNGRIVCQVPIDNCGAGGLANHGSTGMSVGAGLFNTQYDLYFNKPNTYHQVFFYETNRNYWPSSFNTYIDWACDNDPANYGWWTVGMNNAQAYTMCHYLGCGLEYYGQDLAGWRSGQLSALEGCINGGYDWDSGWTHKYLAWATSRTLNSLQSGLIIYSYENWGGFDFLQNLYEWIESPDFEMPADRLDYPVYRDNVYRLWSMAAEEDLKNYFENTLQWDLSAEAKSWVANKIDGSGVNIDATWVNSGVAAGDAATGTGYLMYSQQDVQARFTSPAVHPDQADHFVAVRYNNGWEYDYNHWSSGWASFTPQDTDILVAAIDFDADTASSLAGVNKVENGVTKGYAYGDLEYYGDQWNGSYNEGEWGVVGSYLVPNGMRVPLPINSGVAGGDQATGTGYLMYSKRNVHDRFTSPSVHPDQADHLVIVRYNNGWQYDYNHASSDWVSFTPEAGDILLAALNFDTDTATSLEGVSDIVQGIIKGYAYGNLAYLGDQWNGSYNDGEWGVTGDYFVRNYSIDITPVNDGVAGVDNATGSGFLMYSEESVHDRFTPAVHGSQADHFVLVRYNNGWEYDYNTGWASFTPADSDVLMAQVDLTNDTVTSLEGVNSTENGIAKGYAYGDIEYFADQWAGSANDGEWGIEGSYFVPN